MIECILSEEGQQVIENGGYVSIRKKYGKRTVCRTFLYKENHALDAWFKKAYGDEEKPCYNNGAVCQLHRESNREVHSSWG